MKSEYQLFVCDISGQHEPLTSFVSETPFPTVFEGQRFDDHGWQRLRGVGKIGSEEKPVRYVIHSIKTTIFVENKVNVIQTWLNLKPYKGDRSPAFGNSDPTMTSKQALVNKST